MEIASDLQEIVDRLYEKLEEPDLEIESKKIMQKLRAAKYNPGDIHPLADCMLAILLAAKDQGFSVENVFRALERVAHDIGSKNWKKMPDGTYRAM